MKTNTKSKRGRPAKKNTCTITFRLPVELRDALRAEAAQCGLEIGALIRFHVIRSRNAGGIGINIGGDNSGDISARH